MVFRVERARVCDETRYHAPREISDSRLSDRHFGGILIIIVGRLLIIIVARNGNNRSMKFEAERYLKAIFQICGVILSLCERRHVLRRERRSLSTPVLGTHLLTCLVIRPVVRNSIRISKAIDADRELKFIVARKSSLIEYRFSI